jgi:hypothetical protein
VPDSISSTVQLALVLWSSPTISRRRATRRERDTLTDALFSDGHTSVYTVLHQNAPNAASSIKSAPPTDFEGRYCVASSLRQTERQERVSWRATNH